MFRSRVFWRVVLATVLLLALAAWIPLYIKALRERSDAEGPQFADEAASKLKNSMALSKQGKLKEAEKEARESVESWRKVPGEPRPEYTMSLINLGSLYAFMGDFARAEPLCREACDLARTMTLDKRPYFLRPNRGSSYLESLVSYAWSLNSLGRLYHDLGDYAQAEPLYREARDTWERGKDLGYIPLREHWKGSAVHAASLNNLGRLYRDTGDDVRAQSHYREVYDRLRPMMSPPGHIAFNQCVSYYVSSANSLGRMYRDRKDYRRAALLFIESCRILKESGRESHPDYAMSVNNLGRLYQDMGDYERAESRFRVARDVQKRVAGETHPLYARSLTSLAQLHHERGENARAEPLYREACDILKKALGASHPDYVASLEDLALFYRATGHATRAAPLLKEALTIASDFTSGTSAFLGERRRLALFTQRRHTLDAYLSAALEAKLPAGQIYLAILGWKGVGVGQSAADRKARTKPALRPTVDRLDKVRDLLAGLAFITPTESQRSAWRTRLDELSKEKEELEADLARRGAGDDLRNPFGRIEPSQVADALPDGTVLVDLFLYGHDSVPKGGKGPHRKEPRFLAVVARRGSPLAAVPLGPSRPIDEAVQAWRGALASDRAEFLEDASASLARLVWEPLRTHVGDASMVLFAPDGSLTRFPFAALPGRAPRSYLLEDLTIGYVASGRSLAKPAGIPFNSSESGLLAVGDVDYQADPGRSLPAGRPASPAPPLVARGAFGPLAGTGPEAEAIRDLFRSAHPGRPAAVLTGSAATEAELKRRLDGRGVMMVHLATHGFFESPARVAAARDTVRRPEGPQTFAIQTGANDDFDFTLTPLLQSGVALAGGGRDRGEISLRGANAGPEPDDGILTAQEVQALDLRGTSLVVLSACETGLGTIENGQGVLGLQTAFREAGAGVVMASLWKVDDAATSVLMEQFYSNLWSRRLPPLEALRQAQLAVLNRPALVAKRRTELYGKRGLGVASKNLTDETVANATDRADRCDPALWAAFVLNGGGELSPAPSSTSSLGLKAVTAGLSAVLALTLAAVLTYRLRGAVPTGREESASNTNDT